MKPGEHKTVQARILAYAEAIGWMFVSREEAEQRRGFDPAVPPADRARNRSLFFDDLLDAKVREFNPRYAEVVISYSGCWRKAWIQAHIKGNRTIQAPRNARNPDGTGYHQEDADGRCGGTEEEGNVIRCMPMQPLATNPQPKSDRLKNEICNDFEDFMEAASGFEPENGGFADHGSRSVSY
ncbi:MAG: hypothetical protein R6W95_14430 [Desulfosarcina sp.]